MSRRRLALLAVAAVLVLLFGGRWLALRYTDAAWFGDLGQGGRYRALLLRGLLWQGAAFVVSFAWFAAHTLGVYASIGAVHLPRRLGNLEIDEAVPGRLLRGIALGTAGLLALATAYTFGDLDQYIALAQSASPFGLTEPVLHRDAGFYLAVLPLLEVLHLLSTVLAVLAALLVIGLYAITGSLAVSRRRVRITPHARTHLVVLLAALALVVAWGFQIDALQTVSGGGHALGALTPIDRSVRIPASHALAALALAVAVGSALALRWVRPALLFGLWATLGIATLLGRLIIPVMLEAWGEGGDPGVASQLAQQTDNFSRAAFGLLDIDARELPLAEAKAESSAAFTRAIEGLYAWSGQPELPAKLLDDASRDSTAVRLWSLTAAEAHDSGGALRPAAIAVAQTDMQRTLRAVPRPRWSPLHRGPLAWGGPTLAIDASPHAGAPRWLSALEPADSAPPLTPLRNSPARVRFLPYVADLAIVGPDEGTPGERAPGIRLGGLPRRILLGWALQAPPLLDEHTTNADRILYWRDVPTRLAKLFPFAGFDPARAALIDGRLVWVVDGYLVSSRFPLAAPVRWRGEMVNYLASPYVVTVDAVSGDTRLYLRPAAGAFAASVARSAIVTPLPPESMPAGLRRALRYPEGLLGGQAAMVAQRGQRGASPAQPWSLAWVDTATATHDAARLQPTVAIANVDGAPRSWQFLPVMDQRGNHLVAVVAGTVTSRGELGLALLQAPGTSVPTPASARARISASPVMLAAGAVLSGSDHVIQRGPMMVTVAGGTVIYAQLMYATGRVSDPVRVDGIAVLAGGRTGFGADGRTAVRSLFRGDTEGLGSTLAGAELTDARMAFLALDSARIAGDWERFGRAWMALRRALRLEPLNGGGPPSSLPAARRP